MLLTLEQWAKARYRDPPSPRTLRRWATSGNILPRPRKEGRAYWVPENARYIDPTDPNYLTDVAEALSESSAQQG